MAHGKGSLLGLIVEALRPHIDGPLYLIWALVWAIILVFFGVSMAADPSAGTILFGAWILFVGGAAQFAFRKPPRSDDHSGAAVKARMFRATSPLLGLFGLSVLITSVIKLAHK
jgi:hypothetical protein